jgi:hypothetical protein
MKKFIVIGLLLGVSLVNCDEGQNNWYEDSIKAKKLDTKIRRTQVAKNYFKSEDRLGEAGQAWKREIRRCMRDNDCEQSEEFKRLFYAYAKAHADAIKADKELDELPDYKELAAIVLKYGDK